MSQVTAKSLSISDFLASLPPLPLTFSPTSGQQTTPKHRDPTPLCQNSSLSSVPPTNSISDRNYTFFSRFPTLPPFGSSPTATTPGGLFAAFSSNTSGVPAPTPTNVDTRLQVTTVPATSAALPTTPAEMAPTPSLPAPVPSATSPPVAATILPSYSETSPYEPPAKRICIRDEPQAPREVPVVVPPVRRELPPLPLPEAASQLSMVDLGQQAISPSEPVEVQCLEVAHPERIRIAKLVVLSALVSPSLLVDPPRNLPNSETPLETLEDAISQIPKPPVVTVSLSSDTTVTHDSIATRLTEEERFQAAVLFAGLTSQLPALLCHEVAKHFCCQKTVQRL